MRTMDNSFHKKSFCIALCDCSSERRRSRPVMWDSSRVQEGRPALPYLEVSLSDWDLAAEVLTQYCYQ